MIPTDLYLRTVHLLNSKQRSKLMIPSQVIRVLFFIFSLSALSACEPKLPPLKLLKGQSVNELSVTDVNGNDAKLRLANGKVTILNVWATWCGPCRHEMPSLDRLANSLDKGKIEVIGLSVDTDDHVVREFLIERKVGFKSYMDPSMDAANNVFGIRVFPSTFIFSAKGELLEVIEGWKEWDTVEMVNMMNGFLDNSAV